MNSSNIVEWPLHQHWLATPETDLQPGTVRLYWSQSALLVEAELTDRDIFNPITEFNQVAYADGDVFEIFIRPESQSAYYEIHITPNNQVLQLRWADANAVRGPKPKGNRDEMLAPFKVASPRINSETRIDAAAGKWFVRASIPFALVVEAGVMQAGARWFCSFCRYDYTRGQAQPVVSSTSPHTVCNFHHQHEWQPIVFPE